MIFPWETPLSDGDEIYRSASIGIRTVDTASSLYVDPPLASFYDRAVDGPRVDAPRTNREPAELDRKRRLLDAPHVAPLAAHVSRIRAERGADRVPDFDPTEAGVNAPILLLLEAPGGKATRERGGSGFVSPDNNDGTAANMWNLLRDSGLDRRYDVVTWNVVPWYIGGNTKIRPAASSDLLDGRPYIEELLSLLSALRIVVLIGKQAAHGWSRLAIDLPTLQCPHPSPRNLNSRPACRAQISDALKQARRDSGIAAQRRGQRANRRE